MRPDVLMMAGELLSQAVEHYREAITPPNGTAPASAAPAVGAAMPKASTPVDAAKPSIPDTLHGSLVH